MPDLSENDEKGLDPVSELWKTLLNQCRTYAYQRMGRMVTLQEVEDVVMEVLEKFFSALSREVIILNEYDPFIGTHQIITQSGQTQDLKGYLFTSIKNLLRDRADAKKAEENVHFSVKTDSDFVTNYDEADDEAYLDTLPDPYQISTETAALARFDVERDKQLTDDLEDIVLQLPEGERRIALAYYQLLLAEDNPDYRTYGLNKRVAQNLGTTANKVGVVMDRVHRKMRNWLDKEEASGSDLPKSWQQLFEDIKTSKANESQRKGKASKSE
jgi:DNA-directed RNA polymerase specialized sigma24 family protein